MAESCSFSLPPMASATGQADFSPLGGGVQQARGPHFNNNLDASLFKNFHIHESTALEFRLEAFKCDKYAAIRTAWQRDWLQTV
jgi:hypothetical protein